MSKRSKHYDATSTIEKVRQLESCAVDIETDGTHPWRGDKVLGVAIAADDWTTYVPMAHPDSANITREASTELLQALSRVPLHVYHNALFDLSFLEMDGMKLPEQLHDTMVFAWLANENQDLALKKLTGADDEQKALKARMKAHCADCGHTKSAKVTKKMVKEGKAAESNVGLRYCKSCESIDWTPRRTWGELTYDDVKDYAAKDAEITWALYKVQSRLFDVDVERHAFDREMRVLRMAHKMQMEGIPVDQSLAQSEYNRLIKETEEIEAELPFNLRSPQQVAEYLTDVCEVKLTETTDSGAVSVNRDALLPHQEHPVVARVLEHRAKTKESQFYEKLLELRGLDGRIHPRWRPAGTVSGRWSCSDPNAMQWPRKGRVRDCLVAPDGWTLLSADLSQAELRVAAHYSRCEGLIKLFKEGADVYMNVAEQLGIERQTAKIVVLSSLYGVGARKMRTILLRGGIVVPVKETRRFLKEYDEMFPELSRTRDKAERVAWARGFVKLVQGGRVRHFAGNPMWKANPKDAWNAIVQGGVAETMKNLMLRLEELLEEYPEWDVRLVAQVHDSLSWFVPSGHLVEKWQSVVEATWENVNPFDAPIPLEFKQGI